MIYSAINLRPYLLSSPSKPLKDSYFFLSIGYFNVVLPSFFPESGGDKVKANAEVVKTFWHRAKQAKVQSTLAGRNPMLVSRQMEMAKERVARARAWAKEDDDKAKGIHQTQTSPPLARAPLTPPSVPSQLPPAPSTCLLGVSVLGNLDALYQYSSYPSIQIRDMVGTPRMRAGGLLVYGYTFMGNLTVVLTYDENAFEKSIIDEFWGEIGKGMDEMLLG